MPFLNIQEIGRCIDHAVTSSESCDKQSGNYTTKDDCCKSVERKSWGPNCEACPFKGKTKSLKKQSANIWMKMVISTAETR